MNRPRLPFATLALLFLTSAGISQAQVYKWTDASGQIHYGQKKPDDATSVQTLDIAPPSSVAPPPPTRPPKWPASTRCPNKWLASGKRPKKRDRNKRSAIWKKPTGNYRTTC